MSVTFNASTTSGLQITSDTSGTIQFQSNGVNIANISSTGVISANSLNISTAVSSLTTTSLTSNTITSNTITNSSNTFTLGAPLAAANGYTYLPNGLLLQWGSVVANNSTGGNVTFQVAYTTNAFTYTAIASSSGASPCFIAGVNNTVIQVRTASTGNPGATAYWSSIGV